MHWQAFWDYVEAVAHDIPWWGYAIAIGIFIVGSAIAFIKRGKSIVNLGFALSSMAEVFEHGGFFEHGFTRIERMIVCDGVAKIRGNPWDPCSRG